MLSERLAILGGFASAMPFTGGAQIFNSRRGGLRFRLAWFGLLFVLLINFSQGFFCVCYQLFGKIQPTCVADLLRLPANPKVIFLARLRCFAVGADPAWFWRRRGFRLWRRRVNLFVDVALNFGGKSA